MRTKNVIFWFLLGCVFTSFGQDSKTITQEEEKWREDYAYSLGMQAYIFGYPYIRLSAVRWAWVTQEPKPGPNYSQTPYAALNHIFHFRSLADASYKGGGGPNNDTFYSIAWIDLSKEPVILSHPDFNERYFIFQFAGIDGDNFAAVGARATGYKAGKFALIGPNWKGKLPKGVKALPRSRTNSVFMIARTLVDGKEDAPNVIKLQDQFELIPLSYLGKNKSEIPEDRSVWAPYNSKTDSLADWRTLNRALTEDAPEGRLKVLMDQFRQIGIGPGCSIDSLDNATKRGLARAARDGKKLIVDINNSTNPFMGQKKNGWSIPPPTFGRYGLVNDFLLRAVLCHAGMITPWAEDAYATNTTTDEFGNLLDGSKQYVMKFNKADVPKVLGFWSLTLYNQEYNLNDNPINRYSIGNRTPDLKLDEDGGLTIYIQHNSPGKEKESNWLPSPESGVFTLTFRAYWPDKSIAGGSWAPAGISLTNE